MLLLHWLPTFEHRRFLCALPNQTPVHPPPRSPPTTIPQQVTPPSRRPLPQEPKSPSSGHFHEWIPCPPLQSPLSLRPRRSWYLEVSTAPVPPAHRPERSIRALLQDTHNRAACRHLQNSERAPRTTGEPASAPIEQRKPTRSWVASHHFCAGSPSRTALAAAAVHDQVDSAARQSALIRLDEPGTECQRAPKQRNQ